MVVHSVQLEPSLGQCAREKKEIIMGILPTVFGCQGPFLGVSGHRASLLQGWPQGSASIQLGPGWPEREQKERHSSSLRGHLGPVLWLTLGTLANFS